MPHSKGSLVSRVLEIGMHGLNGGLTPTRAFRRKDR